MAAKKAPAAKVGNNIPEGKVEVFLPKTPGRDEPDVFVGINGVNTLIPRGKKVLVSKIVYDELMRSQEAAIALDAKIDVLTNRTDNINRLG